MTLYICKDKGFRQFENNQNVKKIDFLYSLLISSCLFNVCHFQNGKLFFAMNKQMAGHF